MTTLWQSFDVADVDGVLDEACCEKHNTIHNISRRYSYRDVITHIATAITIVNFIDITVVDMILGRVIFI